LSPEPCRTDWKRSIKSSIKWICCILLVAYLVTHFSHSAGRWSKCRLEDFISRRRYLVIFFRPFINNSETFPQMISGKSRPIWSKSDGHCVWFLEPAWRPQRINASSLSQIECWSSKPQSVSHYTVVRTEDINALPEERVEFL
jgi:hypothetical protein